MFSDPVWLFETIKEKLTQPPFTTAAQSHFARSMKVSALTKNEINGIICHKLESVLDIRADEALAGSSKEEELWIRRGMAEIVDAMKNPNGKDSSLIKKLKQFCSSNPSKY